jgi:inner membrane protein
MFEVLSRVSIHFVQYLLVGFSLCLFYTLLLALSEHISFEFSYLTGALATVASITYYSMGFLKNNKRSLSLGGLLLSLYGYLYVLLNLEDYALLMGAIGLFVVLTLVMILTRKINWTQTSEISEG